MIQTQAPSVASPSFSSPIEEKDPKLAESYFKDASNYKGIAEKIFLPANEEEVSRILLAANEKRIPVTVSGGGTGLTGARVPQTGMVLSTEKMNRILQINWDSQRQEGYAVVEPGVVLKDFEQALEERGLFYPPDPTGKYAFMGGTVATNASGARSFKYGPTRRYVRRLRVVLANGDILELVRGQNPSRQSFFEVSFHGEKTVRVPLPDYSMPKVKNVAGYYCQPNMDFIDFFIGSEGTLGVVTQIELQVFKKPERLLSGIIFFRSEKDSYAFMTHARTTGREEKSSLKLDPRLLEFFDRHSLALLSGVYSDMPSEAGAAIFFEQECLSGNINEILAEWRRSTRQFQALSADSWISVLSSDQLVFRKFRQDLPFLVKEEVEKRGFQKIGTDMAVPDEAGEAMLDFYLRQLSESKIDFLIFGHFGDNHLHANLLPKTNEEFHRGKVLYETLVRKALELGGTISAEHGIGKIKVPYLAWMYGKKAIHQMVEVKLALDPEGVLNPGNIFPVEMIKKRVI